MPSGCRQNPPGSVSPDAVQADYPYHPASGSHIGPQGGKAVNTGRVDGSNRTIFQREGGGYYVLDGQTGKQITVPSPYRQAGSPAGSLHRPDLRVGTRQAVYERYTALPDGSYRDKVSREIIKPPIQVGHAYGWENRRLLRAGEELGMSQKQLNDYVNARPERFRLENGSENMSHRHEKPGNGDLDDIIKDMRNFLNGK